jgi:hypothetical protein
MGLRGGFVANETSSATLDARWTRMRAHKRVLANVRLVVEWEESSKPRSINAFTMDVSYSGCLAVVCADLKVAQMVRLIHRDSGSSVEAQVVWRDPRTWDVGLELVKPNASFWQL